MLGEIISKLPVDVQLGKLIVLGHIFGVLEEAVIIAAGYVFFLNGCQETSFLRGGGGQCWASEFVGSHLFTRN